MTVEGRTAIPNHDLGAERRISSNGSGSFGPKGVGGFTVSPDINRQDSISGKLDIARPPFPTRDKSYAEEERTEHQVKDMVSGV
jgi:hypothetical protein